MNTKVSIAIVLLVGIVALALVFSGTDTAPTTDAGAHIVLHKSPTCGCCGVYVTYLKREKFSVDVHDTNAIGEVKERLGVPHELASCHTMEIAGYVVEGHVPQDAIQKLLDEKPDIKGIGLAGMPAGSPGMPGPKTADLVIYEITHEGERGNVFLTL